MDVPLAARARALRSRLVPAALVVAAALLACRRHGKAPPRVEPLSGESAVLPRASIDPAARERAMRETVSSLTAAGKARRYVVVEPVTLEPGRRYPLVLVFHGDGGDGPDFHRAWPFERATGAEAILAYGEGIHRTWDLETQQGNADEAYVMAMVEEVASSRPVDRSRLFAAGYSSGGFLANIMACRHPGLFRAISSNAGGAPYHEREKWSNGYPKCPGQQPVAMLALHGESDGVVTPDSGRFSAEYWAYVNGCKTDEMETTGYPECHAYRACPAGKAVGHCVVPKLGHWVWSTAAEASWSFFQRQ